MSDFTSHRLFERGDSEAGIAQCKSLLNAGSDLVRSGDIYSVMIEYAAKKNDWKTALHLAQELKKLQPNDNLSYYIPKGKDDLYKIHGFWDLTNFRSKNEQGVYRSEKPVFVREFHQLKEIRVKLENMVIFRPKYHNSTMTMHSDDIMKKTGNPENLVP